METLLAIDIHDNLVSGVLLETGAKVSVVRGYGVASSDQRDLADALSDVVRQTGFTQGECRVSIGAGNFFFRNLVLPFADARKVEKVLPFELEELTSHAVGDLHLDFLSHTAGTEGTEILSAMIERHAFAELLSVFQGQGLDPEMIGVGGLQTAMLLAQTVAGSDPFVVLDIGLRQATLILVDDGRLALVRPLAIEAEKIAGFSFSETDNLVSVRAPERMQDIVKQLVLPVQQTLISVGRSDLLENGTRCFINGGVGLYPEMLELLIEELPLKAIPCDVADQPLLKIEPSGTLPWNPAVMNRALALAIWSRRSGSVLNFRKGDFRKRTSLRELKPKIIAVAIPLVLLILGLIGFWGWEYSRLEKSRDSLDEEIRTVFRETLPEVTRIVQPLQQLKVKLDETREVYGVGTQGPQNLSKLDLLAELSALIPESLSIRITRLIADRSDVRIQAETSDFNAVDNVKRELEKSDFFQSVVISSANLSPKGGGVRFELKLELKQ